MAYVFYFGVSSVLTVTMPTALLSMLLGTQIQNELITHIGCLIVLVSCFSSLGWNVAALVAGFNLIRPAEKVSSRMNRAALTAFAHCGYYAALLAMCSWQNSRLLSHSNGAFTSEDSECWLLGTFSVIYLYALGSANIYQVRVFWKVKATDSPN